MGTKSPNAADRHIGQRIRMHRVLLGMTQERLSEILGISFQQLQKYESGVNRIGAGRLPTLASALQVPVSSFFEGYTSDPPNDDQLDVQKLVATREGIALARAFARIADPALRASLVDVAEALAAIAQRPDHDGRGPSAGTP
jgi:transcriptional regulator with XRE-family HTH domain